MQFTNDLRELDRLSDAVRSFAKDHRLDSSAGHDILLALDELLTNTILHGVAGQAEPFIEIVMNLADGEFTAVLRDSGPQFDPEAAAAPDVEAPFEQRTPGGLGLFLARARMDTMEYRRENGLNTVTLRKKL